MKRRLSLVLAAVMALSALAGCGGEKEKVSTEGKTVITVGAWPSQENKGTYENVMAQKAAFEKENPDIIIEPSTYVYGMDTFLPKAMAGQLPTLYQTPYTEIEKIIDAGYAADITDMMTELGMNDTLGANIREVVEKDSKLYAIPTQLYVQGLVCNVDVFKEAGLVDEEGVPLFPKTYQEVAEISAKIKEKTGKAGFVLPTTQNTGGWHFMNIAWSNGVEFMAKEGDKWVAKFDTKECSDTLQYIKDLKWKYDALPSNTFLAMADVETLFSTGQAAMYFRPADGSSALIQTYGISKDSIAYCRVPEGTVGRVAQMGGTVYMIANNATEEQKIACGKWLDFIGKSPRVIEGTEEKRRQSMQESVDKGFMVGIKAIPMWDSPESNELNERLRDEFCNINRKMVEDYEKYETVTIKPEEPQKCQELYSIIDSCIQAVLTDENADPAQIIHQAAEDFQKNYLDKIDAGTL